MIHLPQPPRLTEPSTRVRTSYLVGEQADSLVRERDTGWLDEASRDFTAFVAARVGVRERWGVPSTVLWWTSGEFYLGSLVIRHELTPELTEIGGHVGYHVIAPWRRQGHATAMLAAALPLCRTLGLDRVLVTCDAENTWSRRVIESNGGVWEDRRGTEDRFWITLDRA